LEDEGGPALLDDGPNKKILREALNILCPGQVIQVFLLSRRIFETIATGIGRAVPSVSKILNRRGAGAQRGRRDLEEYPGNFLLCDVYLA